MWVCWNFRPDGEFYSHQYRHCGLKGATTADLVQMAQMAQAELDDMMEPSFAYLSNEFGNAREIVKNAPYMAEAVNESIQVLPDGNRIVKRSSTLLARDGYGRTRQDKKGARGTSVYIFDPMEGKSYVLNTERKIAVRIPRVPSPPVPPVPPTPPAPPMPPTPPAPPAATPQVDVQPGRVVIRRGGDGISAVAPPSRPLRILRVLCGKVFCWLLHQPV